MEITNSLKGLLEKVSDSNHLKQFINNRKSLLQEIKYLSTTLNFERSLHHVCCLSSEIITYFEEMLQSCSTIVSEIMITPNQKFKYH